MFFGPHFDIDAKLVQQIAPVSRSQRFEGIDFSSSGDTLAIATSDTNEVLLFQRKRDGCFDETPKQIISRLDYPHDVSFSKFADTEFLAVAQRVGAIAVYQK